MTQNLFNIALSLFLVANPIGNTPAFVALVKDFDLAQQKKILFREAIFSFLIAVSFLFIGGPFLRVLQIETYSLSLCGGILLFVVALNMIFPTKRTDGKVAIPKDPFIVPIAIPLITGGGVLSTMMIFAETVQDTPKMLLASCIAWFFITIIVVSAAYLQKLLGKRGLIALEQLMGMMLALMSMELLIKGSTKFVQGMQ